VRQTVRLGRSHAGNRAIGNGIPVHKDRAGLVSGKRAVPVGGEVVVDRGTLLRPPRAPAAVSRPPYP
jgi:hypothetical protein